MQAQTSSSTTTARRIPIWLTWQPIAAGAVLAAFAGAVFVWLAILPRAGERERVAAQLTAIRTENAKNRDVVANFEAFMAEFERNQKQYEEYTARIPLEAEKERVSGDLERLANAVHDGKRNLRARVTLFETGKVKPLQKDHPGVASLSEVPVTINIQGNYAGLKRLLGELTAADRLIAVRGYEMSARVNRGADDLDTVNASIRLVTFFKRMQPALPDAQSAAAPQGK
jgi:Tfp pilus assembly protein PilO